MWTRRLPGQQRGVSLVELIVAMVIIGIAVAGMTAAFTRTSRSSADPIVYKQMAVAAESLLEEILLKPYAIDSSSSTTRDTFNDVRDFHNYGLAPDGTPILGITDVNGDPVAGLESYGVGVSVSAVTLASGLPALQVSVTVTRSGYTFTLTGWRMDYT